MQVANNKKIVRIFAVILVACLAAQDALWAAPVGTLQAAPLRALPQVGFVLPESVAVVEDGWQAPAHSSARRRSPGDGRMVILIQEAHTNPSAQQNLARTLDLILPAEKIDRVFVEGGWGDVSLGHLKNSTDRAKLGRVSLGLLNKGLLKGEEYLNVTADYDFAIRGVESREVYTRSLRTYRRAAAGRAKALAYLDRLKRAAETIKDDIYSPELRALDRRSRGYAAGDTPVTDHFKDLRREAKRLGVYLGKWPELRALDRIQRLERGIDFAEVDRERSEALESLQAGDRKALETSAASRTTPGRLTAGEDAAGRTYFFLLEEKLGASARVFPHLVRYCDYLRESHKLAASRIFDELEALEREVFARRIRTPDERALVDFSKNLDRLERLIALKITPDEYRELVSDRRGSDVKRIAGFLNRKISDLDRHYSRAVFLSGDFEKAEAAAEAFYALAEQRDRIFAEETLGAMDRDGLTRAVLVTGGFHTMGLKKILEREGVSYLSIRPQVLHETDSLRYERILFAQKISARPQHFESRSELAAPSTSASPPRHALRTLAARLSEPVMTALVSALDARPADVVAARLADTPTLTGHLSARSVTGEIRKINFLEAFKSAEESARLYSALRDGESVELNLKPFDGWTTSAEALQFAVGLLTAGMALKFANEWKVNGDFFSEIGRSVHDAFAVDHGGEFDRPVYLHLDPPSHTAEIYSRPVSSSSPIPDGVSPLRGSDSKIFGWVRRVSAHPSPFAPARAIPQTDGPARSALPTLLSPIAGPAGEPVTVAGVLPPPTTTSAARMAQTHDVRPALIEALRSILGKRYNIYPGGFASIDITPADINKQTAIEDLFRRELELDYGIYFGDEFYIRSGKTGNDTSLLAAQKQLGTTGRQIFLFSVDQDPDERSPEAKEQTVWIGAGPEATRDLLRGVLAAVRRGDTHYTVRGQGPDSHKTVELDLTRLRKAGVIATDVDGTILGGKRDDFQTQPETRDLFKDLLALDQRMAIVSGNSRSEQLRRIGDSLKSEVSVRNMTFYVNGGATRIRLENGSESVQNLSGDIPRPDLEAITAFITERSKSDFGLSAEELAAWKAWFNFDGTHAHRPDFKGVRFVPWWVSPIGDFEPGLWDGESTADQSLELSMPVLEVRDQVQVSIKLFPSKVALPVLESAKVPQSDIALIGRDLGDGTTLTESMLERVHVLTGLGDLIADQRLSEDPQAAADRAFKAIQGIHRKGRADGIEIGQMTPEYFMKNFGAFPVVMAAGFSTRFSAILPKHFARGGLDRTSLGWVLKGAYQTPGTRLVVAVGVKQLGYLVRDEYLTGYDPVKYVFQIHPDVVRLAPGKRSALIDRSFLDPEKIERYFGRSDTIIFYTLPIGHGDAFLQGLDHGRTAQDAPYAQIVFGEAPAHALPSRSNPTLITYLEMIGTDAAAVVGGGGR